MNAQFILSPLDGRYADKLVALYPFSENMMLMQKFGAVLRYMSLVATMAGKMQTEDHKKVVSMQERLMKDSMAISDLAGQIRTEERECGHEMVAIIRVAQRHVEGEMGAKVAAMVNFGLTSEDTVNMVYRNVLKEYARGDLANHIATLVTVMHTFAQPAMDTLMLGMTHGQPASPVRVYDVFKDFESRLMSYSLEIQATRFKVKIGGATGGLRAHRTLLPDVDWDLTLRTWIEREGHEYIVTASQINPNDDLVKFFGLLVGLNGVLMDISRDMWLYNMRGVVRMEKSINTVGSSAMPHKVNPIEFENAEGNLGMSTAILQHMIEKLPTSRMQRDLSDSTVLRNLAVPLSHQYLAISSLIEGFLMSFIDNENIQAELSKHPEIGSEIEQARGKLEGNMFASDEVRNKWRGGAAT